MDISSDDIKKAVERYNLETIKDYDKIEKGLIHDNFDIKTSKGKFILKFLNYTMSPERWEQMQLEFKVLEHLQRKNFRYETPQPIKNKYGNYISRINGKYLWSYPKIQGEFIKDADEEIYKKMARALARYHNTVENIKSSTSRAFNTSNFKKYLEDIRKNLGTNKIDEAVNEDIRYIQNQLEKLEGSKIVQKFKQEDHEKIPAHLDFHLHNLLFEDRKVKGIIDFDNTRMETRSKDIAAMISRTCQYNEKNFQEKRLNMIIKEYKKHSRLPQDEEKIIPYLVMYDLIGSFIWAYHSTRLDDEWKEERFNELAGQIQEVENYLY